MPDSIWVHFTQLGHVAGYKQKKRKCNYCQQQINDALRAARTHFRNCNVASLDQKKIYFGNSYEEEDNNDISVESESALVASSSSPTSLVPSTLSNENALTRNTSRSRITNYITLDHISKEEQRLLKLEFARSTFQCGLFLSLPEMEPIKKLWKQARPAFKLPNRKKLLTTLLDSIYDETKKNIETLIKNDKNLCLVSDGLNLLVDSKGHIKAPPISFNQLALKLTITELAHDNHIVLPNTIRDTINNENFWEDVESLLIILDKLVAGIAIFESDTPKLALFYNWYHEQLESDST
ncbi:24877_t:CDS:2 [Gigaspora rosea]|nr:24877_t:CDS:2 [Gigaspora rosea]